jgi:hypothetical protein
LDWRRYSHVEAQEASAGATGSASGWRFAAVLRHDQAAASACCLEAVCGGWRAEAWVAVAPPGGHRLERVAERWRPLPLLDAPYARDVIAPLRAMNGAAELTGEARFGNGGSMAPAGGTAAGVSVLILADGDVEELHRTLVGLHLSMDAGADEAVVLLSDAAQVSAAADLLDRCARQYDLGVALRTAAAPAGELQIVQAGSAAAARSCLVLIRSGDVPGQAGWLRAMERELMQTPQAIVFDRLPAAADETGAPTGWPRAVAMPRALLPLFARVDPTLRTLDAGLADLARAAAGEGMTLRAGAELALRRADAKPEREEATIARRVDAYLLSGRSWDEGVVDLDRVRRAGRRARR